MSSINTKIRNSFQNINGDWSNYIDLSGLSLDLSMFEFNHIHEINGITRNADSVERYLREIDKCLK